MIAKRTALWLIFLSGMMFSCTDAVDHDSESPLIAEFKLEGYESAHAVIDPDKRTIQLVLPYQTPLRSLKPLIRLSGTGEIIPASAVPQDFTRTVYYTVVSPNGTKVIYTVSISTEDQPRPVVSSVSADSVEAGFDFHVQGRYFGDFPLDIRVTAEQGTTSLTLPFSYVSDSTLRVRIPLETPPGEYTLKVKVKSLEAGYRQPLRFTQPAPRVKILNRENLFPPDTLKIVAAYLNPAVFRYAIRLKRGVDSLTVLPAALHKDTLEYYVAKDFTAGRYTVQVVNLTDRKVSREKDKTFTAFSGELPFARMQKYDQKGTLLFTTFNFRAQPYRFYQVTLSPGSKSYVFNGIYYAATETLGITLPADLPKGTYRISFRLSDPDKGLEYSFQIDDSLIIP